jgi:hypothetical protein
MTEVLRPFQLDSRQRALVLVAIAIVPFDIALCSWLVTRHQAPAQLFAALAVDALLFGGGALWLIQRRAGGLVRLGLVPRRWARLVGIAVAVVGLAARVAVPEVRSLVWLVAPVELMVLGAVAVGMRRGISTVLPAVWVETARFELALLAAAVRSLVRRPVVRADDAFSTTRSSQSGQILIGLLLITACEGPAVHLLLHAAGARPLVQWVVLVLHVYGLIWLVGDQRLMQESGHRLTATGLELALGLRWRGSLPYAQISTVTAISGARDRRVRTITPFDAPNVELRLHEPIRLTSYFGRRTEAARIRLFVDEPERLIAELAARITK